MKKLKAHISNNFLNSTEECEMLVDLLKINNKHKSRVFLAVVANKKNYFEKGFDRIYC